MLRIRPDIASIRPYVPGRHIDDVARQIGMQPGEIVKLASNESPEGPFPGAVEAAIAALRESNRYPDNDFHRLRGALSAAIEVPGDHLWFGGGSTALIGHIALAFGGPGTSAVYAWPSFVMYRIASAWAMTDRVEVGLTDDHTHDLEAMEAAIRDDTSVVYLCNPNNPTGTIIPAGAVTGFVESVPQKVLIVVDEAYHHFVDDAAYRSSIPLALSRPNVVVLRTFSKIYSLASLRVGYAVARPDTISDLMKAQVPFAVSQIAQAAATASLGQPGELEARARRNAAGRHHLLGVLAERSVPHTPSQTNFVFFKLGDDSAAASSQFTARGVIVRPMSGGWLRVTVGGHGDNQRFVEVLDEVLSGPSA